MSKASLLSCLVEAPKPTDGARWWPDLFLRKGRALLQVTPEQASRLMDLQRERVIAATDNPHKVRDIKLHDIDGRAIGHVSFNGRVWLHDIDGDKEVPRKGCQTCAELNAKGWL